MKLKLMFSIIVVFAFLSFSCKSGSSPDPYSIGYLSIDYSSIGPVYEVNFGSDDELEINLSGTFSEQDMFLVKMNSNDSVIDSENAGYVKSENVSRSLMLANTGTVSDLESTLPVKKDHLASMNFLDLYQPEEESNIFIPSRSIVPEKVELIDYGTTGTPAVGTEKDFWVEDAPNSFILITATLKAVDYYSYVWVAEENFTGGSGSSTDNDLEQFQIDELAAKFNGTAAPGSNDGIYELVTNVYGFEYGGGVDGTGGIDEDKHINILIYDIDYDYEMTKITNGGVFGYFWPKDHFDDSVLKSNLSEIFYIDSYFFDKFPDSMYSTLAHEFQHMIHFNRKWVEDNKYLNSATWYNEMLSMLAEDILQDKLGNLDPASPKSRTRDFVDGYFLSGVTDWLSGEDVYYSYASAFMFGAFMTRNFGGADLIKAMLDSNSVNQASVTDALVSVGYSTETFDSVFNKYHTALIYSTEDLLNDILVTNIDTDEIIINSVAYTQTAFDIYDYKNYYNYFGPVLLTIGSQHLLRPFGMSVHSDDTWIGLDGTETFNFNIVAPSAGVKYYLMFR